MGYDAAWAAAAIFQVRLRAIPHRISTIPHRIPYDIAWDVTPQRACRARAAAVATAERVERVVDLYYSTCVRARPCASRGGRTE